jgi:hypothetical protein
MKAEFFVRAYASLANHVQQQDGRQHVVARHDV